MEISKGFVVLGPGEMGIRTSWGKPVEFLDSGWHYVGVMPGCGVKRYSKEWYKFDFPVIQVYTGEKEEIKPVPVTIDSMAYVRFPRSWEKLRDILQAKIPQEENELKDWVEKSILPTLRVVLGRFSYREIFPNMKQIRKEVDNQFKESVISQVGFEKEDLILEIREIKLPPELDKKMSEVNEERLKAEAAEYKAEAKGTEIMGSIIQSMSEAYGIPPQDIQQKIKANPELKKLFQETSIELYKREQAKEGVLLHFYRERKEGNKKPSSIEETLENFLVELVGFIKSERKEKKEKDKDQKKPGDMEVRFPGGTTRILSAEERKKMGFSF